jgi:hypothetical protein
MDSNNKEKEGMASMCPEQTKTEIKNHHITTDDLAFSAYLKMKGHRLIKLDHIRSKAYFTFEIEGPQSNGQLKVEFINSDFVRFYNELRNLKKMVSPI